MNCIEVDGEIIYYNINSELMHCKYDKYGELTKAQRIILFFDNSKNEIGSGAYYNDIEKVTNITREDVIAVYKKNIRKKNCKDVGRGMNNE